MLKTLAPLLLLLCLVTPVCAQETHIPLDPETIAANRELDRLLIEAHEQRNLEKLMSLFVKSPDTFFIAPSGTLFKGWDRVRQSYGRFFAGLESISAEIKEVTYIQAGDGVIGVGTVVFHRKDKNAPAHDYTVVWTEFRRREDGK